MKILFDSFLFNFHKTSEQNPVKCRFNKSLFSQMTKPILTSIVETKKKIIDRFFIPIEKKNKIKIKFNAEEENLTL